MCLPPPLLRFESGERETFLFLAFFLRRHDLTQVTFLSDKRYPDNFVKTISAIFVRAFKSNFCLRRLSFHLEKQHRLTQFFWAAPSLTNLLTSGPDGRKKRFEKAAAN